LEELGERSRVGGEVVHLGHQAGEKEDEREIPSSLAEVVGVHPLHPTLSGHLYGQLYQPTTDSPTTDVGVHRGVKNEGVDTSVPGQVDEADRFVSPPSADVAQAAPKDRLEVPPLKPLPRGREQVVKSAVCHGRIHQVPQVFTAVLPSRQHTSRVRLKP